MELWLHNSEIGNPGMTQLTEALRENRVTIITKDPLLHRSSFTHSRH